MAWILLLHMFKTAWALDVDLTFCDDMMTWWFKSSAWNLLGERFTAYQESTPLIYQCTAWLGIVAFGWFKIGHPKATTKLKWIVCLGTPKPIFLSYQWKATFQWFLRLDGGEWIGLHIRMISWMMIHKGHNGKNNGYWLHKSNVIRIWWEFLMTERMDSS